jgi:tRNA pseudouridine65 synthase
LSVSLTVLYRDEYLLGVAKPSGLLVHNGWAREADVALKRARSLAGQYVYPVHRLDRGTSGVLFFALSSEMAREMQQVLHRPDTLKRYIALVRGITHDTGVVDHPLAPKKGAEKRAAVTHFWRLGTFERYSLVLATPLTGRLHQIRRHLKHVSHPLIGDVRYGKSEHNKKLRDRFGLARLALHALSYEFTHPASGERVVAHAHLPADLLGPLSVMGLLDCVPRSRGSAATLVRASAPHLGLGPVTGVRTTTSDHD